MDVSPGRVANSGKNARRDTSKNLPKLNGEQICKQKAETKTQSDVAGEQKGGMSKNPTQTKIPLKRTSISNLAPKTAVSQRIVSRTQMKSVSKVSLPLKDLGCRKLETNSSKLSFRTHSTTNNARPTIPFGKCQTARGPSGISRRSASTISYRSLKAQKPDECPSIIPPLPKVTSTSGDQESHNLSARERVAENNKMKVFETMQKKMQDMQSDFMQKFETLKLTCPEKLKIDFKFISMVRNDECKLMVKDDDLRRLPRKLPVESVHAFKEKIKIAMDGCLMTLVDNLRKAQETDNEFQRAVNLEETHNKLEREQAMKLQELNSTINMLCSAKNTEVDSQIIIMQKEIQDSKKALQLAEKKISDMRISHAEELTNLQKELKEKSEAEVNKKETQIAELNKRFKSLEKQYEKLCCSVQQQNAEGAGSDSTEKLKLVDELKKCKDSIQTLTKKLTHAEQHISHEKKDKQERTEHTAKLEAELDTMKKKVEEIRTQTKTETNHQLKSSLKEIAHLKNSVEGLERDKRELTEQMEDLKQECSLMYELRNQLQDAEDQVDKLQATVAENERLASISNLPAEVQKELEKLRSMETEKRREIEKFKVELSKAHFNICQLEEQIQRDQQLLEVRSELINSLQTNDNSQRIHLEEMFAHVGEKNNTINEVGLNNELRTKSEEFRNLFTTLSTKQMELTRQEHMIKLLEESNERSQMLRVKQEEKIGRMEEEIAQLKQTIGIYQHNVLGNAGCKNLLFTPVPSGEEYNENLYFYTSERRRKRQVDINVKKYET